jgi:hypothetical protein
MNESLLLWMTTRLFGRNHKSTKWKMEYYNKIYKVYDADKNLAGYFFPRYDLVEETEDSLKHREKKQMDNEDKIIELMNKSHITVRGGQLMLPMIKLSLLDNEEGLSLDYTIESLTVNLQRTKAWKDWLKINQTEFRIEGIAVYTAREDRNMLSIVLGINSDIVLGEKEVGSSLYLLLDKLQDDGLL